MSRQFLKFIIVSGIAATANFGSRMLFSAWMAYLPAVVSAFMIGLLTAFTLNRVFVFKDVERSIAGQAAWFTAINLFALAQTVIISVGLATWFFPAIDWTWHSEELAHAAGIVAPLLTSYLGHQKFTFRRRAG